jgi:hypothetical protein
MTKFHFLGQIPWLAAVVLAVMATGLCFILYQRDISIARSSRARWLPWLRSLAVGLIVLMLTEPALQHRIRQGEPGRLTILIDDSASMTLNDGQPASRYQRAIDGLLNTENQLLSRLADEHEVRVVRGSANPTTQLWSANMERRDELPKSSKAWSTNEFQSTTQIGDVLGQEKAPVVVVLTDGRVNQGLSLLEAIPKADGQPPSKIFPVGFGIRERLAEATVIQVEHPDRLFRRDRLTGKVTIRDTLPKGTAYRIQAMQSGELVWEQTMISDERRFLWLSIFEFIKRLLPMPRSQSQSHPRRATMRLIPFAFGRPCTELRFSLSIAGVVGRRDT